MPQALGDSIDRIVMISAREQLHHLYEVARERQGNVSLTMQAAQKLVECVDAGDWVFLLTGVAELPWLPAGEMDGPPGVVSVARAIAYGLGARPLYLAEPLTLPTCVSPSRAAGVPVYSTKLVERFNIWRSGAALPVPLGKEGAREKAIELLDRFKPKALVACEKLGPNAYGEFAAIDGQIPAEVADCVAPILFEEAQQRGILTIGIGDGGNELGLGVIEDVTNSYRGPTPFRKGGNGTKVKSDVAIIAAVSNWGGYGISACLAYLLKNMDCIQDEQIEARILGECAAEGSVDFGAGVPLNHADGRSLEMNQAIVTLLRGVVASRLKERSGPIFLPEEFTKAAYEWKDFRASMKQD